MPAPAILRIPGLEAIGGLEHGFTTKGSGTGDLEAETLVARLGLSGFRPIPLRQVHGRRLLRVHDAPLPGEAPEADASITDRDGILLWIRTADCVPILVADPIRRAAGAAHAGWRGVSLGIPGAIVREMTGGYRSAPDRLVVGIGPAIGPCCYEVGPELRAVFRRRGRDPEAGDFRVGPDGRLRLDLVGAVRRQIREEGVPAGNIEAVGLCTACRADLLYSRRRDGPGRDRLHAFIGWRALPPLDTALGAALA